VEAEPADAAKTDSNLLVFDDPHSGQGISVLSPETNSSNRRLQSLQTYSNMGISSPYSTTITTPA
jgi:hypothetical protein